MFEENKNQNQFFHGTKKTPHLLRSNLQFASLKANYSSYF